MTLSDITTLVSDEQSSNAQSPMLVTLLGIVILVRDEHPENAFSPILVTPLGIDTTRP
jgi:hypothetical protein